MSFTTTAATTSLVLLALLFAAAPVRASAPPPVCYTKSQKCCFTYGACGYESKQVEDKVDCPYQKCDKQECKDECYTVPKCSHRQVSDGEDCKNVLVGYSYKRVCTPKYKQEEYCVQEQKCENKCYPKCYTVPAYCTKQVYTNYPKYCPELACEDEYVSEGSDDTPSVYVEPKGTVYKTTDPVRTDKE